jgi:hypothetical protein
MTKKRRVAGKPSPNRDINLLGLLLRSRLGDLRSMSQRYRGPMWGPPGYGGLAVGPSCVGLSPVRLEMMSHKAGRNGKARKTR